MKAASNGFHGQLRIALSDGIISRLPALLALCRQEEREVEIRFFEVPLSQQIKGLHGGLYDVGFARADEVGDGLTAEPVWNDPPDGGRSGAAFPAGPQAYSLGRTVALSAGALRSDEGHARQVDRVLRRLGMEPLVAERVASCDLMWRWCQQASPWA